MQAKSKEMNFITKGRHNISTTFINLLLLVIHLSLFNQKTEAQQANYFAHSCSNTTTIINRANFQANRNNVLSWLSSNATRPNGFYNTTSGRGPDMVYGLFECRGDSPSSTCQACVTFANDEISRRCVMETTAVIWYSECLVRYSNQNIFSVLAEEPAVNRSRNVNVNVTERDHFNQLMQETLKEVANQAANEPPGAKKYATREANLSSSETLYTKADCLLDLSSTDCSRCLQNSIANMSDCCSGKKGGRVLKPSCIIRFETFRFYEPTSIAAPPPDRSLEPEEERQNKSNWITILVASLSATFGIAVVSVSGFCIRRRRNNQDRENSQEVQLFDLVNEDSRETYSRENVGKPQEFPSIRLDILDAATNHFSHKNKLGEGGFGPVYKGTLADGKEIAVKRLSTTSSQGLVEFRNEVMLIARLQHKNLVRLLGCCLEKNEKLLVYEYMPNGSLDVFLFDLNLAAKLDWQKRFNIIKGIARGILYLHEDSHLRIIHRDLKASNVLLDNKMNPKISDFGMARIFGEDKNEANTKRVVGTYGYMAPEYAMRGHFSIKSDVFSFGVLLLEIISGKKNNSFHHSERDESLLTVAWNLWSKGEGMELIDPLLVSSCVASEVLQCIHIGLLCVQNNPTNRPTMSSVIFMLASDCSVTLSHPTEPEFFVGHVIAEPPEPSSSDGVFSVNEVTISSSLPR